MASLQGVSALLALVGTITLVACGGARGIQQSVNACPGQGSGGGFTSRGEHELVYAMRRDSTGPQLDAAVIVHASQSWRRRQAADSRPRAWFVGGVPRGINGASSGPIWIGHERATGTVWLDSVPVPMHSDNVLLLEVGADDTPRVVGRARVDPRLTLAGEPCGRHRTLEEAEAYHQSLWTAIRRASPVREFLDR